jgi:hypothetical protein
MLKELSYRTYGRSREEVEGEIQKKYAPEPVRQPTPSPFNSYL